MNPTGGRRHSRGARCSATSTPFLGLHAAITLLALDDAPGLEALRTSSVGRDHPTFREVVAPREVVEECRIAALLRAGRHNDARVLLDARLDRRESPGDRRWRNRCRAGALAVASPALRPG